MHARCMAGAMLAALSLPAAAAEAQEKPTFGDEMARFVAAEAGPLASRHMAAEFPARALNGFVVTLDRSRERANAAAAVLGRSALLADSVQGALEIIGTGGSPRLTRAQVTRLSALSTSLEGHAREVAVAWEGIRQAREEMKALGRPLDFGQFREQGLHQVPLNYILTSFFAIGRPQLDITYGSGMIGVGVGDDYGAGPSSPHQGMTPAGIAVLTIAGIIVAATGGSDGGYAAAAVFTLASSLGISIWEGEKAKKLFEEQDKRFKQAMAELPARMPSDSAAYRSYVEGYGEAQRVLGPEADTLGDHLARLDSVLLQAYGFAHAGDRALRDVLLSDRVRNVYATLTLDDFVTRPRDLAALGDASNELLLARVRVDTLRADLRRATRPVEAYMALEGIEELAARVDSVVAMLDSLPLYQPIRADLARAHRFFGSQRDWATASIAHGSGAAPPPAPTLMGIAPAPAPERWMSLERAVRSRPVQEAMKARRLSALGAAPAVGFALCRQVVEGSVRSCGSAGRPYHQSFAQGGQAVWGQNSDGAFPQDGRDPFGLRVGQAAHNLHQRTTRLDAQLAELRVEMQRESPRRASEVALQRVGVVSAQGSVRAAATRLSRLPHVGTVSATPRRAPAMTFPRGYVRWDTRYDIKRSVTRARWELAMTRRLIDVPHDQQSAQIALVRQHQKIADDYIRYADAATRFYDRKRAQEYFDLATLERAWVRGFIDTPPAVEFNLRHPEQTLIETLAAKFPLEPAPGSDQPLPEGQSVPRCEALEANRIPNCNRRTAEVLNLLYGYDRFLDPAADILSSAGFEDVGDRLEDGTPVLNARHIALYASRHPEEWQRLGTALEDEALFQAQMLANLGVGVIAVSVDSEVNSNGDTVRNDHVAVVMPGELRQTGWGPTPNIFNSRKDSYTNSFYYGPMSRAWRRDRRGTVVLYALWNRHVAP